VTLFKLLLEAFLYAAAALLIGVGIVLGVRAAHADPALNPAVTQTTIASTICVKGWTATVRPPWYMTSLIKLRMLKARGETWADRKKYELDHIIPLCLGGAPADASNLQLEPWSEARRKDRVEVQAMRCVCADKVTLEEARHDLAANWRAAYHKYAVMVCRRH
jgi:hypothetical protein